MARLGDLTLTVGADTRNFNKRMNDVQRRTKATFGNIQKLGVGMSAAVTAPLAAMAAKSFGVAADFEQSMAKVAAVSGATAGEFKKLEQDALRLGSATRFTATEVSGLQLEFSKLGFSADEITKVTESTLALAQASGSDLAQSATVAGSVLRAFGLDASETGRVTDVMAASFSSTALDMDTFADSMKYVAPVAKSAGLSLEETTAMLGTLANAGIKGSQAGTSLRRIISQLGATGGDVAGAIENLAKQGLNLADAKDEVGRNAQSALLVLSQGTGVTKELGDAFNNAQGKAKQMAGVMDSTSRGALARMQSAIEGAQIAFGKVLAPVVEKVAAFVGDLANKMQSLSPATKKVVLIVGGLAAALGPLLLAISGLGMALPALGTAIGGAFTVATGPIGLTIAAVAGLAYVIFSMWDEVRQPLTDIANYFISLYNESETLRVAVAGVKQTFIAAFKGMFLWVRLVVGHVKLLGQFMYTAAKDGFGAAVDEAKEHLAQMDQDVIDTGKDIYDGFQEGIEQARGRDPIELLTPEDLDAAKNRITSLFSFGGGGGSPMAQMADDAQKAIQPMKQLALAAVELDKSLKPVGESITYAGQATKWFRKDLSLVLDVKDDITNALIGIGEAMGQLAGGAITGAQALGQAIEGMGAFMKKLGASMITQALAMKEFQKKLVANPAKAALAGIAFVAAGALVQSLGQKFSEGQVALAKGGLAYGPTSAIVGDNPNARMDPEVIAPLSKLQDIMGSGNVQVFGRISGSDILLSNERARRDRNRYS